MASSLILYERIATTASRAKITQPFAERLITKGKTSGLTALRVLSRDLPRNAVKKILEVLGPRYLERPGGYTRILHVGRFKDGTRKVILELVK